jgi:hypothetical protein
MPITMQSFKGCQCACTMWRGRPPLATRGSLRRCEPRAGAAAEVGSARITFDSRARESVWDYSQLEAPQPASLDLQAGKRIIKAPLIPRISANRIPVPLQKLHSMFMPKKQEPEREVSDE